MALCNIVGDLGYLGYAFVAEGFVSIPKLTGACFTVLAHLFLLAYGDDQARIVEKEKGLLSRIFLRLRAAASSLVSFMPNAWRKKIQARPVGIPFLMLSVNGAGLFMDGITHGRRLTGLAMWSQVTLGLFVSAGCGAFAAADFVKQQKTANILTKTAPAILFFASLANAELALTTGNPFIIMSFVAFALSNMAGFFTHIDKEKGQHLHS